MWWRTLLDIVSILGAIAAGVLVAFKLEQDSEIAHKIGFGAFFVVLAIDLIQYRPNPLPGGKLVYNPNTNTGFSYSPSPYPKPSLSPLWDHWLWPVIKEDIRATALFVIAFCITWAGLRLFKVIRQAVSP